MSKHDDLSDRHANDFFDKLSENLKPVRVKSLRFLAIQYFFTLAVLGFTLLWALGLTRGERTVMSRTDLLGSLLVLVLNTFTGSFLLAQYSRPGIKLSRRGHSLFFSILGVVAILEILRFTFQIDFTLWGPPLYRGWICSATALGVGAVAGTFLTFELRHEAPVKLREAALFLLLSAGTLAALVLQIHCPNENPIHQTLWHIVLPLGVFALSSKTLSRLALHW
jgi:hypothetical protein